MPLQKVTLFLVVRETSTQMGQLRKTGFGAGLWQTVYKWRGSAFLDGRTLGLIWTLASGITNPV